MTMKQLYQLRVISDNVKININSMLVKITRWDVDCEWSSIFQEVYMCEIVLIYTHIHFFREFFKFVELSSTGKNFESFFTG